MQFNYLWKNGIRLQEICKHIPYYPLNTSYKFHIKKIDTKKVEVVLKLVKTPLGYNYWEVSSQFFYNSILQIFYEIIFTIFFWKTSFHQINISNNFKSIKNCFTLTDEDVSKLDQFSEFNLTGAHSQSNLSIFHKFWKRKKIYLLKLYLK